MLISSIFGTTVVSAADSDASSYAADVNYTAVNDEDGQEALVAASTGALWGDVDKDGILTANDAALVLSYVLNNNFNGVENYDFSVADVDAVKGQISADDASFILQKVLDSKVEFVTEATTESPSLDEVSVFVVGDSTACHYENTDKGYYVKRTGYGDKLSEYLSDKATVVNLALSGRSSKSFITDPEYQTLLSSVKEGDFVLIGFGHNDEKIAEADRGTTPGGTKDEEGTFKNSVYTNYIVPVQAAGATPILVTPIVRRTDSGTYTGSSIHQTNGGDYAQDMVDLGAELGLTVVNATALTKAAYEELTPEKTQLLHAWTGIKSIDNTHLNEVGASYVSYLIANDIKSSDSKLAPYVKDGIAAPELQELSTISNPDYTAPTNEDPEDLTSKLWTTTSPWYGTVTGDIGGEDKLFAVNEDGSSNYEQVAEYKIVKTGEYVKKFLIQENENGTVDIRAGIPSAKQSYGKIASTSDGFAMYYQKISAAGNFEISGTITVNEYMENSQVAFGAIIADSIKVDTYSVDTYQYVAGGVYKITDIGADIEGSDEKNAGLSSYARIDGTLKNGSRSITSLAPGDQIKVSIKKLGDTFTVTTNGVSDTYEVPMEGDAYAGFYVSRCASITVSDISYNNELVE
jgi:lysophospholipase L1-like esterase